MEESSSVVDQTTKRKKLLTVTITHLQHSMLPPLLSVLCQIKGNIPLNLKYASEWGSVATGPIGQADKLSYSMMGTGLRQTAWVPVESLPAPSPGCCHFFLPVVTLCWLLFPPLPFLCVHQASLRGGKNSWHSEQKTSLARVHSHEWARTVIQSHLFQSVVHWLCVSDSVCLNMQTLSTCSCRGRISMRGARNMHFYKHSAKTGVWAPWPHHKAPHHGQG